MTLLEFIVAFIFKMASSITIICFILSPSPLQLFHFVYSPYFFWISHSVHSLHHPAAFQRFFLQIQCYVMFSGLPAPVLHSKAPLFHRIDLLQAAKYGLKRWL